MDQKQIYQRAIALQTMALSSNTAETIKWLAKHHTFPQEFKSKHIEYAYRLVLDGTRILKEPNKQSLAPSFHQTDIAKAQYGIKALGKIVNAPQVADHNDITACTNLADSLYNILRYKLDIAHACNQKIIDIQNKNETKHEKFIAACRNGDYIALARLYPYANDVLEVQTESVIPAALKGRMDMPKEWYLTQRANAIRSAFGKASSLNPSTVEHRLGKTEADIGGFEISTVRQYQQRHFAIYKDGMDIVDRILTTTDRNPLTPTSIHDLFLRDAAP